MDREISFSLNEAEKLEVTGKKFKVILIQEGLGNFRDCFFYTREALQYAVSNRVFEGKKIFWDHPSKDEEENRPERSTKDVLGHFENVRLETDDNERSMIAADLYLVENDPFVQSARAKMMHAIQYSKKYNDEFLGLSIAASGDAVEESIVSVLDKALPCCKNKLLQAQQEHAITVVRVTSKITDAFSVDLVTQAGAGGKIVSMIEGEKSMDKVKKEDEAQDASAAQPKDQQPPAQEKPTDKVAEQPKADQPADKPVAHDDAAQDAELIKSLIAKDKAADAEKAKAQAGVKDDKASAPAEQSEEEAAQHAKVKGAYAQMGHSEDECNYLAKKHGEANKLMSTAPAQEEECEKKEGDETATDIAQGKNDDIAKGIQKAQPKAPEDKVAKKDMTQEDEAKKESDEVLKLKGEIAILKEKLAEREIADYLDKKLAESKKSRAITDTFREAIKGKKYTTKTRLDEDFNMFFFGREEAARSESQVSIAPEKASIKESKVIDFSKCKK